MADLALMRTFLAVYRCGSLTQAAKLLHLSQPAVSQHLKALEAQTGRPLFVRLPRGISPTARAHALARDIATALDTLEAIGQALRPGTGGGLSGTIYLGGPTDLLATRVLSALVPLTRQGLRLRVRTGLAEELLTALAAGELDLVVATVRARQASIDFRPLFNEDFVLVAGRWWAERIEPAAVRVAGARALAEVPLVAFADDLPIVRRYFRAVFEVRLVQAPAVVIDDLRGVMAAVIAGAGITVLPRYLAADALGRGELVALHEPAQPPSNSIYLAIRHGAGDDPRTVAVADQLMRSAPSWARSA